MAHHIIQTTFTAYRILDKTDPQVVELTAGDNTALSFLSKYLLSIPLSLF